VRGFFGYHAAWDAGTPAGWDDQRAAQEIGRAAWQRLNLVRRFGVELDFDHPLFFPTNGLAEMLVQARGQNEAEEPGLIAVVTDRDAPESAREFRNLVQKLSEMDGVEAELITPAELEFVRNQIRLRGRPVSLIYSDLDLDALLKSDRQDLAPLFEAARQGRIVNPLGLAPIQNKGIFEAVTGVHSSQFSSEIVLRTPWTRRFYARKTEGPRGGTIPDLVAWTRENWLDLALKPERGRAGEGLLVGGVHEDADAAVALALERGGYIVQEKVPFLFWAEDIPDVQEGQAVFRRYQTECRCYIGPRGLIGLSSRMGGVPTAYGQGGGLQPLAVLRSEMNLTQAVSRVGDVIASMQPGDVAEVIRLQKLMAEEQGLTFQGEPIPIALRPRILTELQIDALSSYGAQVWEACLTLEQLWRSGELDELVPMPEEARRLAEMQPWEGSPALIGVQGLFSFGVNPVGP